MATSTQYLTVTISPGEAARLLGITEGTLRNWRCLGKSPRFVKIGRRCRYRPKDIEDYLDSRTRASTSDPGPGQ
ncbi:MAG: hypothetical protein AMXMBFR53_42730 [Gemmatimonadota bacterium]